MTAVIPDMDPTKPAKVNSRKIVEAIRNQGVTNMFASPALLNRVGAYGVKHNIKLPSIKRVVSAGAPVSPANIRQFSTMLSDTAAIHTPYGATEAVPIIAIDSKEILGETAELSDQGFGMCVGRPMDGLDVRIIKITDNAIEKWSDDLLVEKGETGEIVVKGELVSRQYYSNNRATALAKIKEGDEIWHGWGTWDGRTKKTGSGSADEKATGWSQNTAPCLPSPAKLSLTTTPWYFAVPWSVLAENPTRSRSSVSR